MMFAKQRSLESLPSVTRDYDCYRFFCLDKFRCFALISLVFLVSIPSTAAEKKDHPLLSRYPETKIHSTWVDEYAEYNIPIAPYVERKVLNGKLTKNGHVTHILYKGDASISGLRAHHNYLGSLEKEGFKLLFSCINKECGDGKFIDDLHGGPHKMLFVNQNGKDTDSDRHFSVISATKTLDNKSYYVVLFFNNRRSKGGYNMLQDIMATEDIGSGLVKVSLDFEQIELDGRLVLHGLYFDSGQAELLERSNASLKEIADYLNAKVNKKFLVVGHTDSDGDYSENAKLSQRRAEAVSSKLASDYGVDATQLKAVGVSSASPAKSNRTSKGKAQNRRVELVER